MQAVPTGNAKPSGIIGSIPMSGEKELKPCPFCGQAQDEDTPEIKFLGDGPPPGYAYMCGYCGADGPMGTGFARGDHPGGKNAAADKWNHRATPPGVERVPEGVIEILKTVEYAGRDRDGDSCCPICDAFRLTPHAKDCELSAILTAHRAAQKTEDGETQKEGEV